MSHLPECPQITEKPDWYCCEDCDPGVWDDCICDRLRACEQRILDAAFEAVDRMSSLLQPLGPALVAIDALRKEQK